MKSLRPLVWGYNDVANSCIELKNLRFPNQNIFLTKGTTEKNINMTFEYTRYGERKNFKNPLTCLNPSKILIIVKIRNLDYTSSVVDVSISMFI